MPLISSLFDIPMRELIKISDFDAPELDVFVRLTGNQLRSKLEPERGVFIAESPTVIEVALNSGCVPVALLTDERLINGAVDKIIDRLKIPFPFTLRKETFSLDLRALSLQGEHFAL